LQLPAQKPEKRLSTTVFTGFKTKSAVFAMVSISIEISAADFSNFNNQRFEAFQINVFGASVVCCHVINACDSSHFRIKPLQYFVLVSFTAVFISSETIPANISNDITHRVPERDGIYG